MRQGMVGGERKKDWGTDWEGGLRVRTEVYSSGGRGERTRGRAGPENSGKVTYCTGFTGKPENGKV